MKLNFKSRNWHIWTSVVLALPILIVALSALFMAHKKALGTNEITVAANWLPGYRSASAKVGRDEVRSSLRTARGETLIGTLGGLYRLDGEQLVGVAELAATQIRGLAEPLGTCCRSQKRDLAGARRSMAMRRERRRLERG